MDLLLSDCLLSISPVLATGISWFSNNILCSQAKLDTWKTSYTSLIDVVEVHPYCLECEKDKKEYCKCGKNKKSEILRMIDNTSTRLLKINSTSKNAVTVVAIFILAFVLLWVVPNEKNLNVWLGENYFYVLSPLIIYICSLICFFTYKFYRQFYIFYRCCKHYCWDIIGLVKNDRKVFDSIKMKNI